MAETLHLEEGKALLEQRREKPDVFAHHHATEWARILRQLYHEEGKEAFLSYIQMIPEGHLGAILLELPEAIKDEALHDLSVPKLVGVVDELDSDDATDLMQDIEAMDEAKEQAILSKLDDELWGG